MNFVDVQPNSFLDYAFTSPTPAAMTAPKSSKTSRKQNRCCDQCRRGKRACDAAILEDALLEDDRAGGNPTAFHYSDIYGPLASCGNCEKTKKVCTFEWLRSQRVLQSKDPPTSSVPPTKRRRTSSTKSSGHNEAFRQNAVGSINQYTASTEEAYAQHHVPLDFGITFADFATGTPDSLHTYSSAGMFETASAGLLNVRSDGISMCLRKTDEVDEAFLDDDSGKGSSLGTLSDKVDENSEKSTPRSTSEESSSNITNLLSGPITHKIRKRRRSGSTTPYGALPCPAISLTSNLVLSTNNAFLKESLLKIYANSFENALSCWVTERTCPYSTKVEVAQSCDARPDWNRIYHHVFRLDRHAANIRGRQLTYIEDQAAAKALNMAIYSFATQWAQSSQRRDASYPFDGTDSSANRVDTDRAVQAGPEFDRTLQINAWHEAHNALHVAGEVESFRVVLAQIVFALTQKPVEEVLTKQEDETELMEPMNGRNEGKLNVDQELDECDDLLSKLNIAIGADGPPTHLEKGLRLIHSLRSRMTMCNDKSRYNPGVARSGKHYRPSTARFDPADRAAVDLLFWLGVMFDTLSSAMYRRPLVVSDEDSDIYPDATEHGTPGSEESLVSFDKADGLWDGYLFAHQNSRLLETQVRWPCGFDQAAALLCDAAPVKVLLFRKITRIQTLLTRGAHAVKIESSISAALDVHAHWARLYAPFIQDCIRHHDQLHPRIQSWYTCLTGHWHLATLLLADLIEVVNDSERGIEGALTQRTAEDFVALFREDSCQIISDMADRACPRDDASFSQSRDFHFALNQGSLLTEPWTAVLIRVFAKAGVILLEPETMLPPVSNADNDDRFRRAHSCVKALWYLGRKSDMALSAAKILGAAMKERRKGVQEKVNDMNSFLGVELWHGFEHLDGAFEECES
ncbi:hypothetical protein BDU57DRAFT_489331 [Ampelomyces quisqualis]|uniref:Uncharacterized protein n=1 Tax=Ampelomyces quisqualis TaxID=50730 RepID=A0A6A5R1E7_AMPQU|nr:hypothetical protein BDU57DRAFT_489331 [Ampelomyces quisqualis]